MVRLVVRPLRMYVEVVFGPRTPKWPFHQFIAITNRGDVTNGNMILQAGQIYLAALRCCKKKLKNTPWKINMEHSNHPFRKENNLPNLYDYVPC